MSVLSLYPVVIWEISVLFNTYFYQSYIGISDSDEKTGIIKLYEIMIYPDNFEEK